MTRDKRDSIAYLVVIGFCILMLAWGIPTYTPEYPGYGASPALVSNVAVSLMMVMAILSLIRVAAERRRNSGQSTEDGEDDSGFTQVGRVNLAHLAGIMIPCVLLVILIDYIGYELASFAFLMTLQYIIGNRNWTQSIILSIVLTAILYIVMRYGFGVPVPGPQIFS